MKRKFGPIFSYKLVFYDCVGISDFDLIKEALNNPDLSDRPRLHAFEDFRYPTINGEVPGLIFGNGEKWRHLRRFSLRSLRDLGMGKQLLTGDFIRQEAEKFIDRIIEVQRDKKAIDLSGTANVAVVNTLWRMITAEVLEQSDPKIISITNAFNKLVQTPPHSLWTLFPSTRFIIPKVSGYDEARIAHEAVLEIAERHIEQYLSEGKSDDCFIGQFVERAKAENVPKSEWLKELKVTIMDLFGAGSETTSTTLMFAIYILANDRKVQNDLYQNLKEATKSLEEHDFDTGFESPYLTAFIHEVLRFSCIAYMGIPHCARTDTRIGGYDIKAGTMLTLHIWDVLRDAKHFPEPEAFKPERFLKGDNLSKCIPFLTGRRSCPGKAMALQELLIFIGALVRRFEFIAVQDGRSKIDPSKEGLILTCRPFQVRCVERLKM